MNERLSVATNAAAGAMFGVGTGVSRLTEEQRAAAETVAARVLDHVDTYDGRTS